MFDFQRERFDEDNFLGGGFCGEVFPYQENEGDLRWVVKQIKVRRFDDLLKCLSEIMIGFSCDHPCVLPTKGYFIETGENGRDICNVYMKLPRMRMSLGDEFRRRKAMENFWTEDQLVKYFYSLASGLEYLHNKKVYYIDIKPTNILLDNQGHAILCDFVTAQHVPEEDGNNILTESNGTEGYKAPELIRHETLMRGPERDQNPQNGLLTKNSLPLFDSWGLGLTMLELCLLQTRLWNPRGHPQETQRVLDGIRENLERRNLYRNPLQNLIFGLLSIDPANRLGVSDVRARLEEEFREILTEEYRANLGLLNREVRREGREEIIRELAAGYERDIEALRQERAELIQLHAIEIEGQVIETRRLNQEIQSLREELIKRQSIIAQNPRSYKEQKDYRGRLSKGKSKLQERWKDVFEIGGGQDDLMVRIKKDNIMDQELQNLAIDLVRICNETEIKKDLKMLEIELESCYKITDVGLRSLGEQISVNLKGLQHLRLNFEDCEKITDQGLMSLNGYIAVNLGDLRHLELNFDGCKKITDIGIEDLGGQILANLKNLQHVYLSLTGCKGITDVGVKYLEEHIIGNLGSLQHLYLNLDRCSVTHELRDFIRGKFRNTIPLVDIK